MHTSANGSSKCFFVSSCLSLQLQIGVAVSELPAAQITANAAARGPFRVCMLAVDAFSVKSDLLTQVRWRVPGVYVPQLGDDVVYLTIGHQKFWTANNNKLQGPWNSVVSIEVVKASLHACMHESAHVTGPVHVLRLILDATTRHCCRSPCFG